MRNGLLKVLILLDDTGIRELEVLKRTFRVMKNNKQSRRDSLLSFFAFFMKTGVEKTT